MKKFNEQDGIYEHALKGIQAAAAVIGVIFVIAAFFHTVKPAFDRDKAIKERAVAIRERDDALVDLEKTSMEVSRLSQSAAQLRNQLSQLEGVRDQLDETVADLETKLVDQEAKLKDVLEERGDAAYAAINTKLSHMAQDVFHVYLLKIGTNEPDPLLQEVASSVADNHQKTARTAYNRLAVNFFEEFVVSNVPSDCRDWKPVFSVVPEFAAKYQYGKFGQQQH